MISPRITFMISEKRRKQITESHRRWKSRQTKEHLSSLNRKWHQQTKKEVVEAYGGKCSCCGEANLGFLTIDHPNNDGKAHRKQIGGGGYKLYNWLKRNKFPAGFEVQCWNCNCGRAANGGTCPHKT